MKAGASLRVLLAAGAVVAAFLVTASAEGGVLYGVSASKGCHSPTFVGGPYTCFYVFGNTNPSTTSGDTVSLVGAQDVATTGTGPVSSGEILNKLKLVFSGG